MVSSQAPDLSHAVGNRGVIVHTVQPSELATRWRNDVPVLATPVLLWLSELAAMRAIDGILAQDLMTLGLSHASEHLAPTPGGFEVTVTATLILIEARMLTFNVSASDGVDDILKGRHTRAMVNKAKFLAKVESKSEQARGTAG